MFLEIFRHLQEDEQAGAEIAPPANIEEQTIYWSLALVMLITGLLLQLIVFYEWRKNEAYKKPMFLGFVPMFIGDFSFVVAYIGQHSFNLAQGENGQYDDLTYCQVITFFSTGLITAYTWFGMVMVAFALNRTVKNALAGKINATVITKRGFAIFLTVPTVYMAGSYAISFTTIGPYRGLWCGWTSYVFVNGGVNIIWLNVCISAIGYFFYDTYKMLDGHFSVMEGRLGSSGGDSKQRKKVINGMFTLSFKLIAVFLFAGMPTLIEVILSIAGVIVPIEYVMFAGLTHKIKMIADPLLILTMPTIVEKRSDGFLCHGMTKHWCLSGDHNTANTVALSRTASGNETQELNSISESV